MRLIVAGVLLLLGTESLYCQSYVSSYPKEVSQAKRFFTKHYAVLDSTCKKHNVDTDQTLAIVAPEVGMYSVWRDRMETTATELFYVEMGTSYNDFSIGYFQMKPSFAEAIESYVISLSLSEFTNLLPRAGSEKEARLNRIARLKSLPYQAAYLAAFITIWRTLHPQSTEVQVQATAYNAGFWKDEKQLAILAGKKSFPRKVFGSKQFAYGDVAAEYYKSLSQKLNTEK